jgi:GNAT superfamily N-acetyltransferase
VNGAPGSRIERLTAGRADWLTAQYAAAGYAKPPGYFAACFRGQQSGALELLLDREGDELRGYLKVVWQPGYEPFLAAGIPEIQDLNVVPAFRRRGVATGLMDAAEALVAEGAPVAGIGVGLHPGYGAAQRLYALRGYVPDNRPLTYCGAFVEEGQTVCLDDALVMHLTKRL